MDVGHIMRRPTVDIPPRKLLSSVKSPSSASSPHREEKEKKHFCYDSDSEDPYAGDHFRMYEFKIRRCTRSRSHDWTDCPFSHPGEKARRRDPRRYRYTGEVCPEFRRGGDCVRRDECGFAHGVFECWLHPSRYRTETCKDGKHCKRKVCFFAHSLRQLRVLPPEMEFSGGSGGSPASVLGVNNQCCLFCPRQSPTSTLFGLLSRSPSLSPPLSPADNSAGVSRLSRLCTASTGSVTYKELISSFDSVSLTEALVAASPPSTAVAIGSANLSDHHHRLPPWLDVGDIDLRIQQSSLSPSTPSYLNGHSQPPLPPPSFLTPRRGLTNNFTVAGSAATVREKISFEGGYGGDLDLQWVNDLLT